MEANEAMKATPEMLAMAKQDPREASRLYWRAKYEADRQERNSLPALLRRLRGTHTEKTFHEQMPGFLGRDEHWTEGEVTTNPDGARACEVIEGLLRYVAHDVGCSANDLDPLDHAPCTCGLRELYDPFGRNHLKGATPNG